MNNINQANSMVSKYPSRDTLDAWGIKKEESGPAESVQINGDSTIDQIAKFGVGTAVALVVTPLEILEGAVNGGLNAVERGMGISDGQSEVLKRGAIALASLIGVGVAATAGIGALGVITAAVAIPGALGGLASSISEGVKGAKAGVESAKILSSDYSNPKAARALMTPILGTLGFAESMIDGGFKFAGKALDQKDTVANNTGERAVNALKAGTVMLTGLKAGVEVSAALTLSHGVPGALTLLPAFAAGLGAAAVSVQAIEGGVKGAIQGVKEGYEVGASMVDGLNEALQRRNS